VFFFFRRDDSFPFPHRPRRVRFRDGPLSIPHRIACPSRPPTDMKDTPPPGPRRDIARSRSLSPVNRALPIHPSSHQRSGRRPDNRPDTTKTGRKKRRWNVKKTEAAALPCCSPEPVLLATRCSPAVSSPRGTRRRRRWYVANQGNQNMRVTPEETNPQKTPCNPEKKKNPRELNNTHGPTHKRKAGRCKREVGGFNGKDTVQSTQDRRQPFCSPDSHPNTRHLGPPLT